MDNRFIERLWRSVKHEDIYLQDYLDGIEAGRGLARWFEDYNQLRPHAALHYATPRSGVFRSRRLRSPTGPLGSDAADGNKAGQKNLTTDRLRR